MKQDTPAGFKLLGAAHVVAAVALMPLAFFFGIFSAVVVLPALIWLCVLGFRLWNPKPGLRLPFRITHIVLALGSILLIRYGVFALEAARRSAEAGGGLLGAVGLIPLGMGAVAGTLAAVCLLVGFSNRFKRLTGGADE